MKEVLDVFSMFKVWSVFHIFNYQSVNNIMLWLTVLTRHCLATWVPVNTLRPRQNFADDTFNRIFMNENVRILIKLSLKFVPKGPMNIIPALVQIMAWHRPDDKPLSEPVMVSLLTNICVTRPQWVKQIHDIQLVNKVLMIPKNTNGRNCIILDDSHTNWW